MNEKEKEFAKNINVDKANNKTIACITLTTISILSYVLPLLMGDFDFGIVFESITLIFIFMAKYYMSVYDVNRSKRFTILSMIPIGWLLIYDLIVTFSNVSNIVELTFLGFDFVFQEGFIILDLVILYLITKDLDKADNPEKYKDSTDWFFERPDENDEKDSKKY